VSADAAHSAGNAAREPIELELKYRLSDAAIGERLLGAERLGPFVAATPIETVETSDRFLDTSDRHFAAARHALRVRTAAGSKVATLKGATVREANGAHRRVELEGPATGADPVRWPSTAARDRVLELAAGRPLVEVARLRQTRRQRLLRAGRTTVEISLDEVEVLDAGRVVARFRELEAELRDGDPERLDELVRVLDAEPGLRPSPESKFAAALRVLANDPTRDGRR
jgi:inorganic triphosphatase YgiF